MFKSYSQVYFLGELSQKARCPGRTQYSQCNETKTIYATRMSHQSYAASQITLKIRFRKTKNLKINSMFRVNGENKAVVYLVLSGQDEF